MERRNLGFAMITILKDQSNDSIRYAMNLKDNHLPDETILLVQRLSNDKFRPKSLVLKVRADNTTVLKLGSNTVEEASKAWNTTEPIEADCPFEVIHKELEILVKAHSHVLLSNPHLQSREDNGKWRVAAPIDESPVESTRCIIAKVNSTHVISLKLWCGNLISVHKWLRKGNDYWNGDFKRQLSSFEDLV